MIGVRNDYTRPAPATLSADAARARVAELRTAYDLADRTLKTVLAKDDGRANLNALSQRKHSLARDLAEAEETLQSAEAVERATAAQRNKERFAEVAKELRAAREQFADAYRAAALLLGHWYALRQEARELANVLASKMGNGTTYYPAQLQEVLADADAPPNPLPALRGSGFLEIQVALHERTIHQLIPLQGRTE